VPRPNHITYRRRIRLGAVALIAAASVVVGAQPPEPRARQLLRAPRDRGLNVAPVYEGWERNADGTIRLHFGYLNRNWQEALDVPIGTLNAFEPGPADRGQPTHFLPRRHKQVYSVTVPKDIAGPLVWTLSIRGVTESVKASLAPAQQISTTRDPSTGNHPPQLNMSAKQSIAFGQTATLAVAVTDDNPVRVDDAGSRARSASLDAERALPGHLHVRWAKYRGPGEVTFTTPVVAVTDGKATTAATFSEPGLYTIQVMAGDGSMAATSDGSSIPGFSCCWTRGLMNVSVTPGQAQGSR
jgi:hypothetical protein